MPTSRNDCGARASRRNVLFSTEKYILMLLCKNLNFIDPRLSAFGQERTKVGFGPRMVCPLMSSMPPTRNNRIKETDFLNRSCAFDAGFKSMLLGDPSQNPFQQYRPNCDNGCALQQCFRRRFQPLSKYVSRPRGSGASSSHFSPASSRPSM